MTTHSIIAVRGVGPPNEQTDGVVAYESAHLDGVASEKIVHSRHSTQGTPANDRGAPPDPPRVVTGR